jgi:hypothetical protein
MLSYKDLSHYLQGNVVFASPSLPLWDLGPSISLQAPKIFDGDLCCYLLLWRNNGTIVGVNGVKHHTKASSKHILSMFII